MPILNSKLAERVQKALDEDARTTDEAIEVVADDGVITLSGTVPSEKIREAAEKIAGAQEGVISVINDLALDEEEEAEASPAVPPPSQR